MHRPMTAASTTSGTEAGARSPRTSTTPAATIAMPTNAMGDAGSWSHRTLPASTSTGDSPRAMG